MSLIFISHSGADKEVAAEVRLRLQEMQHQSIFLDFDPADGIPAGRDWEQEIYRNIRACRVVVVLCSKRSMDSRWCFMEITYARALGKHLFPVKVEDCDLAGVLTDRQVIDLTMDRDEAYSRLERGLLAAGLDPADTFDWDGTRPPYPGLPAFQEEDAAVFFGRGEEIGEGMDLLNRVRRLGEIGWVMVLGASGTGKSSLVRAGLVPRLRKDLDSWLVVGPFRPRDQPARELAGALSLAYGRTLSWQSLHKRLLRALDHFGPKPAQALERGEPGQERNTARQRLLEQLRVFEEQEGARAEAAVTRYLRLLRSTLEQTHANAPAANSAASAPWSAAADNLLVELALDLRLRSGRSEVRILLVVDQFEELLGHPEDHPASRFLAFLRAATEQPGSPLLVLGTLRSDFLGAFQKSPGLLDLRFETLSLGPMSPEDIAEVIEKPARVAGLDLEPGLVQALLDEAEQDALPLLAFTLRELQERCAGSGVLKIEVLRKELGGLKGAVARVAGDLLRSERLGAAEEDQLRKSFLKMVRLTEDGRYARQPARRDDHPLLEKFVEARLLVPRGEGKEGTVEVAHEALFTSWGRLRQWLDQNREGLHLRREIHQDAVSWEKEGRVEEEILWRGGRLARARELIDSGDLPLEQVDLDFIKAAEKIERDLEEEKEAQRRRRLRVVAASAIGAAALACLAFIFALQANRAQQETQKQVIVATRARLDTQKQAIAAEERAREAEIARLRALSAQNFAEHERVKARADEEQDSDRSKALAAIVPKYLEQSRLHLARARELEMGLAVWRQNQRLQPAVPDTLFSLEVLKAKHGGCLILHYGPLAKPRFMLFDGGVPGTYRRTLRPRLLDLRRQWMGNGALPIELIVSSQTDDHNIHGLLDLFKELEETPVQERAFAIRTLWSNAFLPGTAEVSRAISRRRPKTRLVAGATALGIPVNEPFSRLVTLPEAGAARVHWNHGLSTTVLGPPVEWVRQFANSWLKDIVKAVERRDETPEIKEAVTTSSRDYEILESFTSPQIELLPSPIEIVAIPSPGGTDRSPANLASIVLMLELNGKRMLLPSNSRGDILLQALAQAGYVNEEGSIEVDLLILPQGGSDRSVSDEFFRRVRARHYVIQGNGKFDNPEVETFGMLFEARRGDGQPFTIYLSHPREEFQEEYPFEKVCSLFEQERRRGTPFRVVTPAKGRVSLGIALSRPDPSLDPGVYDRFCPPPTQRASG
jgi:hypothetical protein